MDSYAQDMCVEDIMEFLENLEIDCSMLSYLTYDFLLEHELCGLKPIESLRHFLKMECNLIFTQPESCNFTMTDATQRSYPCLAAKLVECSAKYFKGSKNNITIKKEFLKAAIELGQWGYSEASRAINHGIQTYISTHKIVPGEIYPTFANDIECYGLPVDEEEVKKLKGALTRKQMKLDFIDTLYDFELGFERDISCCQRLQVLKDEKWVIGSYAVKRDKVAYLYDPLDPSREIATLGKDSIVKFA